MRPTFATIRTGCLIGAVLLVTAIIGGCARTDDDSGAGAGPAGTNPNVTVKRTGGIAGVNDTYTLDSSGRLTHTNKAGASTTANLSTGQRAQVVQLVADSRLAAEAQRQVDATNCRDAFDYIVTVDKYTVSYTDCPSDPDQPVAAKALVAMIMGAVT